MKSGLSDTESILLKQMNETAVERLDDECLIECVIAGDRSATGILYSRYYRKVYHSCASMVRNSDDAFDLAQESLLKAIRKLDTFRRQSTFSTWLFTITHRVCLAALRNEKSIRNKNGAFTAFKCANEALGEEACERDEQESITYGLINALSISERLLLTLKYRDGETIEKLQSSLNVSASTIKMRLARSKKKLNTRYMLALNFGLNPVLNYHGKLLTKRNFTPKHTCLYILKRVPITSANTFMAGMVK